MPKTPEKNDRRFETDEDLGIGHEDAASILNNPALAELINKAVEARLAQLGANAGAAQPSSGDSPAFAGLLAAVERMFQLQAIQQPGYIKPISSEEMERRAAGKVEMEALLMQCHAERNVPSYVLGDKFYAGDVLYAEGQEIRTYLPPAEHFQPTNDTGRRIYAAMMQWIGGRTQPIGELVEEAMQAAKANAAPFVTGAPVAIPQSPVEVIKDAPIRNVKPPRVAGTIVPETHGVSTPSMPATAPQPMGPIFIDR